MEARLVVDPFNRVGKMFDDIVVSFESHRIPSSYAPLGSHSAHRFWSKFDGVRSMTDDASSSISFELVSRRSPQSDDPFNILMFNDNAEPEYHKQYELGDFSSQAIDLVHFSQVIVKIAHVSGNAVASDPGIRVIPSTCERRSACHSSHIQSLGFTMRKLTEVHYESLQNSTC